VDEMTDRELLEVAAKAAGIDWVDGHESTGLRDQNGRVWNPLTDDGDAMRLAVKLRLVITQINDGETRSAWIDANGLLHTEPAEDDYAATRRAIVRAAAEIGRSMK
jgi:hypothetical protein